MHQFHEMELILSIILSVLPLKSMSEIPIDFSGDEIKPALSIF